MGKTLVCDFCDKQGVHHGIKVRGEKWYWRFPMWHAFTKRLYLCDDCFYNLKKYCKSQQAELEESDGN